MNNFLKNFSDILSYTFSSMTSILLFVLLVFFFDIGLLLSLIISLAVGAFLMYKQERNSLYQKEAKLGRVSSEKEAFYKSKGMTKEEIQFFRETMHTAKQNILKLEKNMNSVTKLKAIENRNNTIQLAKSLFKEITNEPNRLHEVDKFLYVHLPSLVDLTNKYLEINNHEVKNKTTFGILEESAATIDEMSGLIAEDYVSFKEEDIEDMEIEVELARKTIERDNGGSASLEKEEL